MTKKRKFRKHNKRNHRSTKKSEKIAEEITDTVSVHQENSLDISGVRYLFTPKIMETPRINQDNFDYPYPPANVRTPVKQLRRESIESPLNIKDSPERIQDLNNLQGKENVDYVLNCTRTLNSDSLKHLRNFNELILSTSQSADYENCESTDGIEPEMSGTEKSFFTPQLYNGKPASTPVQKKVENEIVQCDIGIQTNVEQIPLTIRKSKERSISKYSPYNKVHSRTYSNRESLESSSVRNIKLCTEIVAKLESRQETYSLKLAQKILDVCSWIRVTVSKGIISIYNLYTGNGSCDGCQNCVKQIIAATKSLNNLQGEIKSMKDDHDKFGQELHQLEDIKKELCEIKNLIIQRPVAVTPPPFVLPSPPPPPPPLPQSPLTNTPCTFRKMANPSSKKMLVNENTRPIISLDDILKVKLRKTMDRARLTSDSLINMKVKSVLPNFNLSRSPISSFRNVLQSVDSNEKWMAGA